MESSTFLLFGSFFPSIIFNSQLSKVAAVNFCLKNEQPQTPQQLTQLQQPSMDSKTSLLEDDRLSSLRRRNKSIILFIFTLIIVLALIIGAIIISLVHKHNSQPQEFNPSAAIREYCAPSPSYSQYRCITALYYDIKTTPNMYPDEIFTLSLETTVADLSTIISMASNDTSSKPPYGNCTSSLSHAVGQLGEVLGKMRVNPDVETQSYEQRRDMIGWIAFALEDLDTCSRDLGKAESTATIFEVNYKLSYSEALMRYSKDFLENCEYVNDSFRFALASEENARNQVVWDLIGSSLFGLQYFVLVLLFCLLLRNYY